MSYQTACCLARLPGREAAGQAASGSTQPSKKVNRGKLGRALLKSSRASASPYVFCSHQVQSRSSSSSYSSASPSPMGFTWLKRTWRSRLTPCWSRQSGRATDPAAESAPSASRRGPRASATTRPSGPAMRGSAGWRTSPRRWASCAALSVRER